MKTRAEVIEKLFRGREPFLGVAPDPSRRDLQGWQSSHDYLSEAIQAVRPHVVVEIGVWKGASSITMANAIKAAHLDAVVIAVDTWLGSSEMYLSDSMIDSLALDGGYPTLYRTFLANIFEAEVQQQVVPLPLDSLNALQLFKERDLRVDVLHIDAGHDLASVTADLEGWWPLLKPGGVLIGDDYQAKRLFKKDEWPEVRQAFDSFFGRNAHVDFKHRGNKCWVRKPS